MTPKKLRCVNLWNSAAKQEKPEKAKVGKAVKEAEARAKVGKVLVGKVLVDKVLAAKALWVVRDKARDSGAVVAALVGTA